MTPRGVFLAVLAVVLLSLGGCTRWEMSACSAMCGAAGVELFTETTVPGIAEAQPTCRCRGAVDGGAR